MAVPTRVANFDFRYLSGEDSLTLSFSRSAPPLAAIEDERLPVVHTEPSQEMRIGKHTRIISAGIHSAWPRLRKYARYFERKQLRLASTKRYVHYKVHNPFSRVPKLLKVSDLVKLVAPVTRHENHLKKLDGIYVAQNETAGSRSLPVIHNKKRFNLRESVDAPLTAPSVMRGLPRGEDEKPKVVEEDRVSEAGWPPLETPRSGRLTVVNPQTPVPSEPKKPNGLSGIGGFFVPTPKVQATRPANPPATPRIIASAPPPGQRAPLAPKTPPAPPSQKSLDPGADVMAFDGGKTASDPFQIVGQVELAGGLAVAGGINKLNIQWKTGNQKRDALIDYSTGQFVVKVPTLDAGKIVATLTDQTGYVLGRGDIDLDGMATPGQPYISGVKIIIDPKESNVGGRIYSAYSVDNLDIPVSMAEIFGPAQTREVSDVKGNYKMSGISSDSTFALEAYAPDHWGTRVLTEGNRKEGIPLFPSKMVQSFFDLIGEPANNTEVGIVWGEVKRKGATVAGAKVALSSGTGIGPIYFNALRIPDKKLTETSQNGLFAFVKVSPGLHVVMAQYQNRELPSVVASVFPSMVSYAAVSFKSISLQGKVIDPVVQKNIPAQISVIGASQTTQATEEGFRLKIPSSDAVLFVEANPGGEYLVSRSAIPRSKAKEIEIYAFKRAWLDEQMKEAQIKQSESKGMLLGYVTGPTFHVSLDNETYSDQNIFYFDEAGKIDGARMDAVAGGGTFLLTNLSPGLHTLVVTSAEGEMVATRLFVSEAGVLNVVNMPLRP